MEQNNPVKNGKKHKKHRYGSHRPFFVEPPSKEQTESKITIKDANAETAPKEQTQNSTRAQKPNDAKAQKSNDAKTQKSDDGRAGAKNAEQGSSAHKDPSPSKSKKHKRSRHRNKNHNATENAQSEPVESRTERKNYDSPKLAFSQQPTKQSPDHTLDDYEEYTFPVEENVADTPANEEPTEDVPRTEVVGIRFKNSGKTYFFDPCGQTVAKGSYAIVDTARGQEFGTVSMSNSFVPTTEIVPPLRPLIRIATQADIDHHEQNKKKEQEVFDICNKKIAEHKLDMKLIEAQYTFDNSKLLFYFTSADRVDFRELVKDLAANFHTRIELRQIGIRDEAKLMGGLGMCGRPLCCSVFLSDFNQVSIKMAKEQNLSLNSAKISGICGRLMCCLKYEHETYEYEIKRTPPVDSLVRTENGDGTVTEISPLTGMIKVKLIASPDTPPKAYHRDSVTMLRKKQKENQKEITE